MAGGTTLVMSAIARDVLRPLRPLARVVLEDVALDAVWHDGVLVAATSARRVAEHLGVDAGTAAAALRTLRDRGFVRLEQATGHDGRFGLAVYTLHLPAGVEMMPCADPPHTVQPHTVKADTASTNRRRQGLPRSRRVEQATLDLGLSNR
jgi:hypothetical protein